MQRGVIFDLDGTLADTLRTIAAALNDGLTELDLPVHPVERVAGMVGAGVRVLCEKGIPAGAEARVDELMAAVRRAYDQHPMRECRLYDGIASLVDRLIESGATLGVLSNKPHVLTVATLDGLGLTGRFAHILGYKEEFPLKPDPTSATWLASKIGVAPERTLYVGDTPIDVETATRAGFRSIAVTWGFQPRYVLAASRPDYLVDDPNEIAMIYDRLADA